MRVIFIISFILFSVHVLAQKIDSIDIPKRVVYKYCDPGIIDKAKKLITKELSDSASYSLDKGMVFIGPILWSRYRKIPALEAIPGGNITILYNKEKLAAKLTQEKDGFKKIWDQVRAEVNAGGFKFRKATYNELAYYWSVISFDIEEPLLIVETAGHRYILNLSPKDLALIWLDEVPPNVK
jgi:hypothetical protein